MALSKCGFLVCLFVFLCLSLSSANRVLKDNDAGNESSGQDVPSGQDDQLHGFGHAGLKGSIPKFSSVGSTSSCCNYGSNCGQNGGYTCPPSYGCGGNSGRYTCPPSYGCGGNSGCQSYYSCPPCEWQGCQGTPPPSCGCMSIGNNEVQHESALMADPDTPTARAMPPTNPENQNVKSNGGLV